MRDADFPSPSDEALSRLSGDIAARLEATLIARLEATLIARLEATLIERLPPPAPEPPRSPARLLTSWREILIAIGKQSNDRRTVIRLNDEFNGPIPKPQKGGQPVVDKAALLNWWDSVVTRAQEAAKRRDDARLSAQAQHQYGRDGTVAPDLGGHVKRRRRDRKR